jgi:hypothetical protein
LEDVLQQVPAAKRVDIFIRIVDLFLSAAERYRPEHIDVFEDVLGRIIAGADLLPFNHLRAAPTHPAWRTQQRYAWRRTRCRRNDLLIAGFINCTADISRRTQNPTLPSPDQIRLLIIID